jgi:hypothetical protein
MGERRCANRVLVGKPEGRRPLGRPTHRWEDNSKNESSRGWMGGTHCTDLIQDRDRYWVLVNAVMNLWAP